MAASDDVTMVIIGGDALALSTARDISLIPGTRVVVLWPASSEFAAAVKAAGAVFVAGRPESREGLAEAGVEDAISILALSDDDQLNLQAALRARDVNPRIRIVLRQFNRTLAAKIEENLPNCSVLSLSRNSAATYAAAALDPSCFRGLQFPERDGPLTGFAYRAADRSDIAGHSVGEAEAALGVRIVALDGETTIDRDDTIASGAQLIVYATMEQLLESTPRQPAPQGRPERRDRMRHVLLHFYRQMHRTDPYIAVFAATALTLFALGAWYFRRSFDSDWLTATYFVLTTITTTGYGDITPNHDNPLDVVAAMTLMLSGTVFTGILIAFVASRLTHAQWVRMQGLRPIHRHGHIVVCGCGRTGTRAIELLLAFDKPLVVVEQHPDAALVERARDQGFDLLTGDASRDDTLDLCNLDAAHSLVALTNVDTLNLEIALGGRARNPSMPIVLRIAEAEFAASIARHFQFETTFSIAALAGPVFGGLARFAGARGRIAFDGREFALAEIIIGPTVDTELLRLAIPLAAAEDGGDFVLSREFAGMPPGTRALILMPIAPFREGTENLGAMVERVAGG
jgi:voltage-gated potassium channel Kch